MKESPVVFRSKVDAWLVLALVLALLPPFAFGVAALKAGEAWLSHVAVGVGVLLFIAWLILPTKYTVTAKDVVVQCGPFRWRINTREITQITPSRSLTSSPALSIDRLKIEYDLGRKAVLVSPVDKEAFIAAVRSAQNAA
jgi:hypothetical protein